MSKEIETRPKIKQKYTIFNNQLYEILPDGSQKLIETKPSLEVISKLWTEEDELAFQAGDMNGEI